MNITKLAINNNRVTYSILVVILFLGMISYNQMSREDMPPFTWRVATIVTSFPGASPERVEMLISDKIEKVIQEIPEVDFITSESRTGISVVVVAIKESESEMRPIFDEIRRKVDDMKYELPSGIYGPEVNDELGDVFGIVVGLTGEGFSYAELKDVADDIRDGIIKIPNAAKVDIVGEQEERVFIDYNNAKLAELGMTKQQLQNILASTNIIFPGGDVKIGNERIILEPTGNFESLEDLKKTIITSGSSNQLIYLGDVTNIYRGYVEPVASITKINGMPGLAIGISVKQGGNIIELGKEIDEKLIHFLEVYPHGIDIQRIASQDISVNDSVNDFLSNVVQSVVVVLFVMLLFLGFRTGFVVASLIPMVMIMTLF